MLKGGQNSGQIAPRGIHISTSVYGKAVRLAYGLVQMIPDLIWYNDWRTSNAAVNPAMWVVVGGQQGKKSGKSKKSGTSYYSAAVNLVLGHAPVQGILSVWYNNQKFNVPLCSASGFISGNSFSFSPHAGGSLARLDSTVPSGLVITAPNFVSDGQTTQNDTGVADHSTERWLVSADPTLIPGPGQYTVDVLGNYRFNVAQLGDSITCHYRELGSGDAGLLVGIYAVSINEAIPPTIFDDFGAPGSVSVAGHWDRPLWNRGFPVPGRLDAGAYAARDPYSWAWDGVNPTVTFPDSSLDGCPVTVYFGVPVIDKSDGSFYSAEISPLGLLQMEFEPACGSGSEYVNHPAQQDVNDWCCGLGSTRFDLGTANAMPNLQMEAIAAFTVWPNGDAHVADVMTDIVMSGPIPATSIPHGANCNDYDNGGYLDAGWPPGNGLLFGAPGEDTLPIGVAAMHAWCVANGISVALNQDTQRTCKDLLDELAMIGNSAPVYSGDTLTLIPYDEVSSVGYGAVYNAPTASGPVAFLTDQDFVREGNEPPVELFRGRRTNCDNAVSVEFTDRSLDYVQNVATDHDPLSVALYGPRKGGELDVSTLGMGNPSGSKRLQCVSNATIAQKVASVLVKRSAYGVDKLTFTLKGEYFWLEAMDLVAVSDKRLKLAEAPVRLTSVKETAKRTYECEGDKFVYGLNHPTVKGTAAASGSLVTGAGDPGMVNPPIIFQPTSEMSGNQAKVTIVVAGSDPNYGGCIVNVSIDAGESYRSIGTCPPAVMGALTADYPLSVDPDTTHVLAVDVTESGGEIDSETVATADASLDECFVAIEAGSPLQIVDFEIVCPTAATLTSAYHYNLASYIRRGVKGSTYADHPVGSRFALLDGNALTVDLDPYWVGRTIMLKFQAFNKAGGNTNPLPTCAVYTFTPAASCGKTSYNQTPSFVLSQTAPGTLAIAAVSEDFGDHIAKYSARPSIAIPGGAPSVATWLYLTITDPTQTGDPEAGPLPINVDTTDAKSGVIGYTYLGSIKVLPSGDAVQVTPGGWPPPQGIQVGE